MATPKSPDNEPQKQQTSLATAAARKLATTEPMNQTQEQLRLTIEALKEKQEDELVNNRDFGLLHNADFKQRIHTRSGPPTPDDMDELLATVWKDPSFFLAHPPHDRGVRSGVQPSWHLPDQHRPERQPCPRLARHSHLPL